MKDNSSLARKIIYSICITLGVACCVVGICIPIYWLIGLGVLVIFICLALLYCAFDK